MATSVRSLAIRSLKESDLPEAERLVPLAFATHLGLDPDDFHRGASCSSRWFTEPEAVFGAFTEERMVGVIFAVAWGSFGFFGPLVVHPEFWGQGIGQQLLEPIMDFFSRRRVTQSGLFTFSNSAKHLSLYQKFGYWPQHLTALMSKAVSERQSDGACLRFSEVEQTQRQMRLDEVNKMSSSIYKGLALAKEIETVARCNIGDTVLLRDPQGISGFAICHYGEGSEAEAGTCYVKFGGVRSGRDSDMRFARLLDACESLAHSAKAKRLTAGVNTSRHQAYRHMLSSGMRTDGLGVAMLNPNKPGFNHADAFVIDDWR